MKTKMKQKPAIYIRGAYYEASDKIMKLVSTTEKMNDAELQKLANEIQEKLDEYEKKLSSKYLWD